MALKSKVGSLTQPGVTGNQAVTGLGFQPTAILFFANSRTTDGSSGDSATATQWMEGMATSSSARGVINQGLNGATGQSGRQDNTKCIQFQNTSSTVLSAADLVSLDSDGFTINWTTADATARIINYIAIGGTTNASIKTFQGNNATGNQAVTGLGFQPDCIYLISINSSAAPPSNSSGLSVGHGIAISNANYAANKINNFNSANNAASIQKGSKLSTSANHGGTIFSEATLNSFDADGFTINWSSTSNSYYFALCLKGGSYSLGTLNQPTSTGNQAITGLGFLPAGLLLTSTNNVTSASAVTTAARLSLGVSDGTNQASVWTGSNNTPASSYNLDRAKILKLLTETAPTLNAEASIVSFDNSGGFTLNWDTVDATAREVIYLAFGNKTAPVVTTGTPSNITSTTATFNGNISAATPGTTARGVQINTVAFPGKQIDESGSFATGSYTESLTGLSPNTTYYIRAYATNSVGTTFGNWISFTTLASTYSIKINGVDRTSDILAKTLTIEDNLNDQQDVCNLILVNRSGLGFPQNEQEIVITLDGGTKIFGGIIITTEYVPIKTYGLTAMAIQAVDYVRLFDSNLVHRNYNAMTDAAIINDILSTYCAGFGITSVNVLTGVTIDQISFNYIQPSQAMRKICDLTARNWYIDYNKDIHYFPAGTNVTPFNITDSGSNYWDLDLSLDSSQLKNRVYVRGGTKLSDPTTFSTKGDGTTVKFIVPDKPHNISLTVNGIAKSVGVKNIDLSGFDFYVNFEEKYFEQDATGSILSSSDVFSVTYSYDIPILVAVENAASIAANGVKEFAIFDNSITTDAAANNRAAAELTDYAAGLYAGSFYTMTSGFKSGQTITINSASRAINTNYIVTKVHGISLGSGTFQYQVTLASAKTMGIIRFLIELLEQNQNLVAIANTEVVDNLQTITDSLLSDSITDSLVIDSAGAYSTWCPDSISTTPKTLAKWDLFQWG